MGDAIEAIRAIVREQQLGGLSAQELEIWRAVYADMEKALKKCRVQLLDKTQRNRALSREIQGLKAELEALNGTRERVKYLEGLLSLQPEKVSA